MESYLKGKKRLDEPSAKLSELKSMSQASSGIPAQDLNKVEIASGEDAARVECVTQDGRITKIIVYCKCGDQIELNCKYGA